MKKHNITDFKFPIPGQSRLVMKKIAGDVRVHATTFFRNSFREQGFTRKFFIKWQKRASDKPKDFGRAILVKSGNLRRSIYSTSSKVGDNFELEFGNKVPYAAVHNDGFRGTIRVSEHGRRLFSKEKTKYLTKKGKVRNATVKTVRTAVKVNAHNRNLNMPRRRFIGPSITLDSQIIEIINKAALRFLLTGEL